MFLSGIEEISLICSHKNHLCKFMSAEDGESLAAASYTAARRCDEPAAIGSRLSAGIRLIFILLFILLPQINKTCFCWVPCRPHTLTLVCVSVCGPRLFSCVRRISCFLLVLATFREGTGSHFLLCSLMKQRLGNKLMCF